MLAKTLLLKKFLYFILKISQNLFFAKDKIALFNLIHTQKSDRHIVRTDGKIG